MRTSLILLGSLLLACGGSAPAPASRSSGAAIEHPAIEHPATSGGAVVDLLDAAIPNVCGGPAATLALHRGVAAYDAGLDLGEGEVEVSVVDHLDLDHDGVLEWIAYVVCRPGGSGTFDGVYAFREVAGALETTASIPGGDRADGGLDEGARVDGDEVVVGRYSGTDEGLCCPTAVSEERWTLEQGAFVRRSVGPPAPVP